MRPRPTRVLVLGGTGMLGHACVAAFRRLFDVHASVRDVTAPAAGALDAELHQFDVGKRPVDVLLKRARPEVVVNCIGLVRQRPEASDARAAFRLNGLFPLELRDACAAQGSRLIQISTDCVFSGDLPVGSRYREDHPPDPIDLYGRSKLLGELDAPALTIRTSFIGPELERRLGLMEWFRAQSHQTVVGYRRAIFSGLTTTAFAEILAAVIEDHPDLNGVYHVASEAISKHALLGALRDVLGVDCRIIPADTPVINRALDGTKFASRTGLTVRTWDEMVVGLADAISDVAAA